jgi:hypothetical protein
MVIRFPSFLQLLLSEFFRTASRTNLIPPRIDANLPEQFPQASLNFVAISIIRVQQIGLQKEACCLPPQSAKNDLD